MLILMFISMPLKKVPVRSVQSTSMVKTHYLVDPQHYLALMGGVWELVKWLGNLGNKMTNPIGYGPRVGEGFPDPIHMQMYISKPK